MRALVGNFTHSSWGFVDVLRGVFVGSSACLFSHDVILADRGRGNEFEPGVVSSASGSVVYRISALRSASRTRQLMLSCLASALCLIRIASVGVTAKPHNLVLISVVKSSCVRLACLVF